MKKEKLREIKEKIESQMVRLNEQKKQNDSDDISIDKKIQYLKNIQNKRYGLIDSRKEIIDDCENALENFLKEEENNKKLSKELEKKNSIFDSGARLFKIGKAKLKMYDHDKVKDWYDTEEEFLASNRRLHELYMKLRDAESRL